MRPSRIALVCMSLGLLLGSQAAAQVIPFKERNFNEQVLRPTGQPVVPLYEGWYPKDDGTARICFGYFNLNTAESFDVPLGPNNFIEPREYDGMQPTHFDPVPEGNYRRHLCVFTVEVPADFGDGRVVWTLSTGGETLSTPGKLLPPYILDEPESDGRGIVPPILQLDEDGPRFRGRDGFTSARRTVRVGERLTLHTRVDHPGPRAWVGWAKHQGPGTVGFLEPAMYVGQGLGVGLTSATFDQPGEYLLRVQSIYSTASFEYHCCWTNGYVPVTVTR